MKKRLHCAVMQGRRDTVYKMISKRNDGTVPCFVCGRHVKENHASLEHKLPLSHGGTDDFDNLAISHNMCNLRRGNNLDFPCDGLIRENSGSTAPATDVSSGVMSAS